MSQKTKYIGVTIGPIFDTINLSSSPAALWAASYFFSSLTANICAILTDENENFGVKCSDIVSPYYSKNEDDELLNQNNGVGLFHDRIIFHADNFDISAFAEVRSKAIVRTAEQFGLTSKEDISYLNEYVMVSYKEFMGTNPISDSKQLLACLELSKPFVFEEKSNPLFNLFTNTTDESDSDDVEPAKEGKNEAIKKLLSGFDNFQLIKYKNKGSCVLKSIEDIVHTRKGTGLKKYKYYAIVRADGDSMGNLIDTLQTDDEIRKFSETCLNYCSNVAKTVDSYNGVTIYAGGDDLLAILPCQSKDDSKTVFHFIRDVNALFSEAFSEAKVHPTLSFGVHIAYYRFPLYEALDTSYHMLTDFAKKGNKNSVAVRLQKHSGQSEGLVISNTSLSSFLTLLDKALSKSPDLLLSAMHKFYLFETLFDSAKDYKTVENLCINTFDSSSHSDNNFLHKTLPEVFWGLSSNSSDYQIDSIDYNDDGEPIFTREKPSKTIQYLLRTMKFFTETGGDF